MAPCFTSIGGVQREQSKLTAGIGGAQRELASAVAGIGGVQREIFGGKGIALADLAEGTIVYLNENGSPVEFYVAKHNYVTNGKTLLFRKEHAIELGFHEEFYSNSSNLFSSSTSYTWLNNDYLSRFDSAVAALITNTRFPNNGLYTNCKVAMASLTELGLSSSDASTEGSALPIASILRTYSGSDAQWTRTSSKGTANACIAVTKAGKAFTEGCDSNYAIRPIFTFPATAIFDSKTMQFVSA